MYGVRLLLELAGVCAAILATLVPHRWYLQGRLPQGYGQTIDAFVTAALLFSAMAVYALIVSAVERRRPDEMLANPGAAALGLVLGFGLYCSVYLVYAVLGVAYWQGLAGLGSVVPALLMALSSAIGEELVFRGVLFRILEESFGSTAALLLSAVLFGVLHAGNPGATYLSTVAVALEAGVLLAAAYAWCRSLWLPIGLHFSWNFTEGGVFGAAVSGSQWHGIISAPLSRTAPAWITGGAFGPEASLVAIVPCAVAAALFVLAAWRARRWTPWRFRLVAR